MKTATAEALVPLDDRVVIRPDEPEQKSRGGIVLPDRAQGKPQRGIVLSVGPGRILEDGRRVPVAVESGDRVIYTRYSGNDVEIDGEELKVMSERDILAKLEK